MSDVLEEAETLLVELPEAVSRRKFGDRLSQTLNELKNAETQISRMKALLETSNLIGYGELPHQREVITDMSYWANSVGKSLEEADDGEALRSATFDYTDSLNKSIVALERAIHEQWRSVVIAKFQPLVQLGNLLSQMNVAKNLATRLVECGRAGSDSVNIGLATERLAKIKKLLADQKKLQDEHASEIGEAEVGEFIKALVDDRATLAMVTPKVHNWLVKNDALGSLGVTTRR